MKNFRYLENVTTLKLDQEKCIGCSMCEMVCPHTVFKVEKPKASIVDNDGCMECGACASNCPVGAISVNPGVGCASYIIQRWIKGPDAIIKCG
jgi:NAD-dependent dihydropyrimidine dehydrogenase PreA subunit